MKNNTVLKIAFTAVVTCLLTVLIGIALGAANFVSEDEYEKDCAAVDKRMIQIENTLNKTADQQLKNSQHIATLLERTKND